MPSTTNFSWTTPADTDLVKDGALAIRTLGNGIDTSLVDLKGGTTGQALTKATNTDLDYSWTSIIPASESLFAAKNKLLNSDFSIWQRGTSFTSTNGAGLFAADRWQIYSASTGRTYSRQSSGLTGIQYCLRVARNSGNTATNALTFGQNIETVNAISLAGKSITISFYARKGADYSAASSGLNIEVTTGTGTDENGFYAGYTGSASIINQTATLTTSWQRFSYTGSVGSTATELAVIFRGTPVGTAGTNDYYEVTGVQLEVGTAVTVFQTAMGFIGRELAACQRYYFRTGSEVSTRYCIGFAKTTTVAAGVLRFPVRMRTAPTALEQSGTASDYTINYLNTGANCTAVPVHQGGYQDSALFDFTVSAVLTAGQAVSLINASGGNGYLAWSAEL